MANSEISVMGSNKKHVMEVGDGKTLALQIITYGSHFVSHDLKTFVATVCTQTCQPPHITTHSMHSTHPLTHAEFTTPTEQPGFFCKERRVFLQVQAKMDAKKFGHDEIIPSNICDRAVS